ncbi:MAG: hypothetical protein MJ204_02735 [Bacteroidales bacterium]|nr:hypothetical protein [Bacteroidales bacterium]MCQ2605444.1 hypothetical protein [Bacteroidales bacterium]
MFKRLQARFASWYINRQINNCYVNNLEKDAIASFVALVYGFVNCVINTYSYSFYTDYGVYVYNRCNGRIYFFRIL